MNFEDFLDIVKDAKTGDKCMVVIDGTKVDDAALYKESDRKWYICQNEKNGGDAPDKLGYKHSWSIYNLNTANQISDLKLVDSSKSSHDFYDDWEKLEALPDEKRLKAKEGEKYVIIGGSYFKGGDIVELTNNDKSVIPRFSSKGESWYVSWNRVAKVPGETYAGDVVVNKESGDSCDKVAKESESNDYYEGWESLVGFSNRSRKTAEKGERYVVLKAGKNGNLAHSSGFKNGSIITVDYNDSTACPAFKYKSTTGCFGWCDLAKIPGVSYADGTEKDSNKSSSFYDDWKSLEALPAKARPWAKTGERYVVVASGNKGSCHDGDIVVIRLKSTDKHAKAAYPKGGSYVPPWKWLAKIPGETYAEEEKPKPKKVVKKRKKAIKKSEKPEDFSGWESLEALPDKKRPYACVGERYVIVKSGRENNQNLEKAGAVDGSIIILSCNDSSRIPEFSFEGTTGYYHFSNVAKIPGESYASDNTEDKAALAVDHSVRDSAPLMSSLHTDTTHATEPFVVTESRLPRVGERFKMTSKAPEMRGRFKLISFLDSDSYAKKISPHVNSSTFTWIEAGRSAFCANMEDGEYLCIDMGAVFECLEINTGDEPEKKPAKTLTSDEIKTTKVVTNAVPKQDIEELYPRPVTETNRAIPDSSI